MFGVVSMFDERDVQMPLDIEHVDESFAMTGYLLYY